MALPTLKLTPRLEDAVQMLVLNRGGFFFDIQFFARHMGAREYEE
jgi:hypothetical protein